MLVGMALVGIAGFAGLLLWQFQDRLSGLSGKTGLSLPYVTSVVSTFAPVAVFIGLVLMVWILTRDSSFMER